MGSNATIAFTVTLSVVVFLPLLIMAIVLLSGRGGSLIAGYNTMSNEKKAIYDEKAMCRATGGFLLALIFCLGLLYVGIYSAAVWLTIAAAVFLVVLIVGFLIYANTGKRFLKEKNAAPVVIERTKPRAAKAIIIAVIAISAIVLVGVAALLIFGSSEPDVLILDNGIQIKAMYGRTVEYAEIANISLIEQSMGEIGLVRRTNGFGGFGQALKGNFRSDSLGELLLFVQSDIAPTIWIECFNARDVYISFRDSEATKVLYNELIMAYNEG